VTARWVAGISSSPLQVVRLESGTRHGATPTATCRITGMPKKAGPSGSIARWDIAQEPLVRRRRPCKGLKPPSPAGGPAVSPANHQPMPMPSAALTFRVATMPRKTRCAPCEREGCPGRSSAAAPKQGTAPTSIPCARRADGPNGGRAGGCGAVNRNRRGRRGDDVGVVDVAVDDGGGDDLVGENVAPAAEGPVRGDDGGCDLVAGRRQVKEQVGGAGVERDVADLVDDQLGVISSPPSGSSSRRARPAVTASRCCCIAARFTCGLLRARHVRAVPTLNTGRAAQRPGARR
jgi:hypothetical protein